MSPTDEIEPKRSPLHAWHEARGGRMVPFAGWLMPVQYPDGVIAEHTACRSAAALFDVSHMAVVDLVGSDVDAAAVALERLVPGSITRLGRLRQRYTLLTSDEGGIIDDLMVLRLPDRLVAVVNAARRDVDLAHLRAGLPDVDVVERTDVGLLALQGPSAAAVLDRVGVDVAEMAFLDVAETEVSGVPVVMSRSGYTGEDGFELIVPADDIEAVADRLGTDPDVAPAGLGARDTLRLEAGLCLHGNDIGLDTTPAEADLGWTIPRRRREAADFPGAATIVAQLADGPRRRRVGLAPEGRRPVREGAPLRSRDGSPVGSVTSGGFGPTVEAPVAMGYVDAAHAGVDTELVADVRGNDVVCRISDLPFVPHRYVRRAG